MIALLCPGQGAQKPGMLQPWISDPDSAALLDEFSSASGLDLADLGTNADADTIKDTAIAQPLIVAASLLSLRRLVAELGEVSTWANVAAGHSVGEFSAIAAAGVLPDAQAVDLVGVRGRAMAKAAASSPTTMAAVMGGDPDEVARTLAGFGAIGANVNGGGQIVAAGTEDQIANLRETPPPGARVVPLAVAGAFHTEHMASAAEPVNAAIADTGPADPAITLLSNADGQPVTSGDAALQSLVSQITSPVRWDLCQAYLAEQGVSLAIELAPGGVLTGLARRTLPCVKTVAIKSPDDVTTATAAVRETQER